MTIRHVYLDLEDTVVTPIVDGWFNYSAINIEKIKAFLEEVRPDYVHIFSFALRSPHDLNAFKLELGPLLERKLGVKFSQMPLFSQIVAKACHAKRVSPESVSNYVVERLWGKQEAFRLYIQSQYAQVNNRENLEVFLIDDLVQNENFQFTDLCISGKIININSLKDK